MNVKEFIEILKQCDIEKELRFDFIKLGIRGDSKEFKIREWGNCVDILPGMPKKEEDFKNMWQKMRKSELYNLLNKITVKFMNKESPTVKEIRRLEKLTNEDLFIMEDEEMESFIFGMWSGVESFIKEQEE